MLSGKPRGQALVTTSVAGQQTGRILYITEHESRLRFLVDTCSEVSIIPPSKVKRKNRHYASSLLTANNLPFVTYGTCSLTLNLGLRRTFRWVFIVVNVRDLVSRIYTGPAFGAGAVTGSVLAPD